MATAWLGNTAVREVVGADPDGTPIHRRYTGQATCTRSIRNVLRWIQAQTVTVS